MTVLKLSESSCIVINQKLVNLQRVFYRNHKFCGCTRTARSFLSPGLRFCLSMVNLKEIPALWLGNATESCCNGKAPNQNIGAGGGRRGKYQDFCSFQFQQSLFINKDKAGRNGDSSGKKCYSWERVKKKKKKEKVAQSDVIL